ncbi:MAG TPA: TlpA disulfide reductase family protein [Gemmatimonadaceae bacterium]|nr:TlpA disulfide reductase family protein [Gemmatimonadaceae bacterium]
MTSERRPWKLAVAGGLAMIAGAAWLLRPWLVAPPPPVTVGAMAPDFHASTVTAPAQVRTLGDYAGRPLLLNLWATWCQPCREEMPSFERLYRDAQARGLRIVAVSVDDAGADAKIADFVARYGLTFDVLHDRRSRVMAQYQVRGVPETFLIAADGRIVATQFIRDWASPASRALVDSLLLAGGR